MPLVYNAASAPATRAPNPSPASSFLPALVDVLAAAAVALVEAAETADAAFDVAAVVEPELSAAVLLPLTVLLMPEVVVPAAAVDAEDRTEDREEEAP